MDLLLAMRVMIAVPYPIGVLLVVLFTMGTSQEVIAREAYGTLYQ